jgi:very-short-patch-repair endonuclease
LLWWKLRRKGLGWKFRRQVPVGPYIIDFACVEARLAIEVDGATHRTVEEIAYDMRRTSRLEAEGWRVVRFWNREIFDNLQGVAESISQAADEQAQYMDQPSR